jgi:hypothetical protein
MKFLKISLILLVTALLLFVFLKNVDMAKVAEIIKDVNPLYPLAFALGSFLQFFVRAHRWGIILKPYKNKMRLSTLYDFTMIGYLVNFLIPGRVGEPAKGILLARNQNFSRSAGLASVVLERLIDFFMVVIFFLVSLLFIDAGHSPFLEQARHISLVLLPLIILLFFSFYLLNTPRIFPRLEKMVTGLSRIMPGKMRSRMTDFTLNFIRSLNLKLNFIDFIRLFLVSIMVWLLLIPCYWILMMGFGIHLGLLEVFPYFSIIVVSASIPTPGMAGSIDAGSKFALTQLYGVPADRAVAYTLLFHFLVLVLWIVFGFISLLRQGIKLRGIKNIKKVKDEVS